MMTTEKKLDVLEDVLTDLEVESCYCGKESFDVHALFADLRNILEVSGKENKYD